MFRNLKELMNLQNEKISKPLGLIRKLGGFSFQPLAILFFLTYRCNLKCFFCLQPRERKKLVERYRDMNRKELRFFVENVKRSFIFKPRIHLFGGEPLLHPEFGWFIAYLKRQGFSSSVTTNGFELKKFARDLVVNEVEHLNVSIDDIGERHDKARGVKGVFERALNGIEEVGRLREEMKKRYPRICINITINDSNYYRLEEIVEALQGYADSINLQHLIFYSSRDIRVDSEKLKRSIIEVKKRYRISMFPGIRLNDLRFYYSDRDIFADKCIRPWIILTVMPNGDVVTCPLNVRVGNVLETPLRKIWNSKKFREFRNRIERNGIKNYTVCRRCCHRQYY